ncbi:MAG: hypothetical protein EP329_19700 [Deltaproteobacteria bacterium]|nr:MAG: hypothetical protein EP329_19700 [Deltaproteobacteria bacterium]
MTRLLLALGALLVAAPALADPAPLVRPASGPSITGLGLALPPPPATGRGLYHGDVFTIGNDRVSVVITESGDPARPARWTAVDEAGRVAWEATHACPDFADYTLLEGDGDRLVCKRSHEILAVDAADGAEVWRFHSDTALYITGIAGGRVATSVDNQQVLVLDAADGREIGRWAVDGSVLEAVTNTPDGPVGLMIVEPATAEERRETLTLGDETLEVTVTSPSPERRMGVLPLGGPAWRGTKPMALRWSVPFEGYSFDLVDAGGVVVGQPREDTWVGYDLATGERLWERVQREGETLTFGEDGAAFSRADGDGAWVYGALDPRTARPRWEQAWPHADAPVGLAQGSGQVAAWNGEALYVARFDDGAALAEIRIREVAPMAAASTSPRAIVWVAGPPAARRLHFRTLAPAR